MQKNFKKVIFLGIIFGILFSVSGTIYALSSEYTVLSPLPGTTKCGDNIGPNCTTDFKTYLPGIIKWSIGVAAVMAFAMITFGGITYATSDSIAGTSKGREYVTNAI